MVVAVLLVVMVLMFMERPWCMHFYIGGIGSYFLQHRDLYCRNNGTNSNKSDEVTGEIYIDRLVVEW